MDKRIFIDLIDREIEFLTSVSTTIGVPQDLKERIYEHQKELNDLSNAHEWREKTRID